MITAKDVNALMELREMQKICAIKTKYSDEISKIEALILNAANDGKHQIFLKKYDTILPTHKLQLYFKTFGFKVEEIEQPIIRKRFFSDPEFIYVIEISW